LMRENESITHGILSKTMGVSEKTISSNIRILREAGFIERLGSDKMGKWKVK